MTEPYAQLQAGLGSAYRLKRELGGGGMARVFLAEETALARHVVIKVLTPELAEGLSAERFAREVRVAARLQHPNILPVFTAGVVGDVPYYTMPYVDGESLRARIERDGALALTESVDILRDVARALAYAHEQAVVHRDIKPENILLSRDAAVVADFGIAKAISTARGGASGSDTTPGGERRDATAITQIGSVIGTPAYMAPEQAAGDPAVDARADLYAWGIVAYEVLAGRHPFADRRTAHALMAAHLAQVPPGLETVREQLPLALVALVSECLEKSPDSRPTTARQIVERLGRLTPYEPAATPSDPAAAAPSIGVLPFVNLSADPDNEYFSDGMSEEVLSVLAQDRKLRVAARSSCFAFKGTQVDLKTIAERLHVTTLVEGSVRRAGNRIRIAVQLVNAADGYHLWSDRFDRELTDVFAVQDEIARAIVAALRPRLQQADEPRIAFRRYTPRVREPVSVEAYDEYLKGKYANQRRGVGHDEAPSHFERALALEPDFAAAHAGLGESYLWLGFFFAVPPVEAFARVRQHAQRALALDPNLADAHWLLAEVALWHDWDADAAESHVAHTLALESGHAGALMTRALCHNTRCQRDEALAAADAAVRMDPVGLGTRTWSLAIAYNVGALDRVVAEATRLIAEHPSYSEGFRWRAMAHSFIGNVVQARADQDEACRLARPHVWTVTTGAVIAALEGRTADVQGVRDELIRRSATEWVPPIAIGQVEQARGDYEAAFAWYERAYQSRDFLMTCFHTDPGYRFKPPGAARAITDDSRWMDLVRRVGLAPVRAS